MKSSIPIKNLYYLLCYAWDRLEITGLADVFTEGQHDATNLLARILVTSASFVVRRGIDRSYVRRSEFLRTVRGRFDVTSTISKSGMVAGKACCEYEEFDPDVLHNQIMKATLRWLLRKKDIAAANRNEAEKLLHKLNEVSDIQLCASVFRRVQLHRNNAFYAVVLDTCELLFHELLPSSDGNRYTIHEFGGAPQEMGALFQRFVANFYRRRQKNYIVKPQYLEWLELKADPSVVDRLPKMRTDIILRSSTHSIIIDCKFYKEALRGRWKQEHIRTEHLFQISAYARNFRHTVADEMRLDAILLYPVVKRPESLELQGDGYGVKVKFINLNQDWAFIHRDLLNIIGIFDPDGLKETIGPRLLRPTSTKVRE
jgi:5-methylcytosine-specific restriction enzyme subunit McrC